MGVRGFRATFKSHGTTRKYASGPTLFGVALRPAVTRGHYGGGGPPDERRWWWRGTGGGAFRWYDRGGMDAGAVQRGQVGHTNHHTVACGLGRDAAASPGVGGTRRLLLRLGITTTHRRCRAMDYSIRRSFVVHFTCVTGGNILLRVVAAAELLLLFRHRAQPAQVPRGDERVPLPRPEIGLQVQRRGQMFRDGAARRLMPIDFAPGAGRPSRVTGGRIRAAMQQLQGDVRVSHATGEDEWRALLIVLQLRVGAVVEQ